MSQAKITRQTPAPEYAAFIGAFSGRWVATRSRNGQVEHSVRRATREAALRAVEQTKPDAPTLDLVHAASF